MQGTPAGIKQEDNGMLLQLQIGKKSAGLHVVFQNGENGLPHPGKPRWRILQSQNIAIVQERQFVLKQTSFGGLPLTHGIKNRNQVCTVLPDLIMQHLGGKNVIRKKGKGTQGKKKRDEHAGKRAGRPFLPTVKRILKEIQAD